MGRTTTLVALLRDMQTIDRLVLYVRGGAFPHVAARAVGVPQSTHYRWMELGEQGRKPYREYWERVTMAAAEARAVAEVEVRKARPLDWLRYGPARDRPGDPGWAMAVHQAVSGPDGGPVEQVQRHEFDFDLGAYTAEFARLFAGEPEPGAGRADDPE